MRRPSIMGQDQMKQEEVIARIKETAERVLPAGASLWLYGSRARGDASPDSDYDLLILLDKEQIKSADYDNVFALRLLGVDINEEINPTVYSKKQWSQWDFVPFHDNVESDKHIII